MRLWDATGRLLGSPLIQPGPVSDVAFSPNGTLLATASDDSSVRLWDLTDVARPQIRTSLVTGQTGAVNGVAFSPDATQLATAGADGVVRLWDVATASARGYPLSGHTGAVNDVDFSADGSTVATASADGTARLWNLGFSQWVDAGCRLVKRNLSMSEWRQFAAEGHGYERTCPDLPSGDGAPGGNFEFRLNALPGDATRDGVVSALDLSFVKQRLTRRAGDSPPSSYSPFADLNGDGLISALDVAALKQRLTTRLPAAPVAAVPPARAPAALFSSKAVEDCKLVLELGI